MSQIVTLGRMVVYRSHNGNDCSAVVSRIVSPDDEVVDLTVFSPTDDQGTFVERSVAPAPDKAGKEFGAGGATWPPSGTWRWPERV